MTGTADLRQAAPTWFAIPTGPVQGDIAVVPRAIVIDYTTFERSVLPFLKTQFGTSNPILNPGLTGLPPVSIEAHVAVDHSAYPSDPGRALRWSSELRRVLASVFILAACDAVSRARSHPARGAQRLRSHVQRDGGQRRQRPPDGLLAHGQVLIARALLLLPRGDTHAHAKPQAGQWKHRRELLVQADAHRALSTSLTHDDA